MRHLRSSFYIAIVSLFVLTGYGSDLFGDCGAHHGHDPAEHHEPAPQDETPGGGDGCQCICHMPATPLTPDPVAVAAAVFVETDFAALRDEFPPDAVPLGIEYPPQLA